MQGSNAAIAATLGGQISNLKDQFTQLAVNIGTAVNPILKDMIGLLSDITRGWSIVFKQIGEFRNNAAEEVEVVGGTPVSAFERGQFNFVRDFLKDIDRAIQYGGKGTLARVRGLQFDINEAFKDGIISQQVLFTLSAKLRESVKIFYRDGDGDLGSLNDNTAQKENVFVRAYEKKNGVFSFLIDQNATMPNLTPTASNKSIEGEIEYLLQLPLQVNNDTLYYEVYIQDRAGHKSIVLKTKEIVVTTF